MQRLHYTGDTLLVSDEVCDAILQFAAALAESQGSDVVAVPVRDETGALTMAELLLGPASQLYAMPATDVAEIDVDPQIVAEIRERTARLRPVHVVAVPSQASGDPDLDME